MSVSHESPSVFNGKFLSFDAAYAAWSDAQQVGHSHGEGDAEWPCTCPYSWPCSACGNTVRALGEEMADYRGLTGGLCHVCFFGGSDEVFS